MRVYLLRQRGNKVGDWLLNDGNQPQQEVDLREGDQCTLRLEMASCDFNEFSRGDEIQLRLSGASVEPHRYEEFDGIIRISWRWNIEFYAGEIVLNVSAGKHPLWSLSLDVSPHEGKLGREAYEEMLRDLFARAENVIFGTTSAQLAVTEADVRTPLIARLAMLQAHFRELERSFAAVTLAPNRRLVAERENRPLDRVRRIDTRAFRGIIRSPSALVSLGLVENAGVGILERPRIDHPRREHTFDTPPNRHIVALIQGMQSVCQELHTAFHSLMVASENDPETQARACSFQFETEEMSRRLHRLSLAEFLENVEAGHDDTAAMLAVAKDPTYSRFDYIARRILRPRVSPGESLCEKLWLRRTYELYEYWCFFRIAECLAKVWKDLCWKLSTTTKNNGLLVDLSNESYFEGQSGCTRILFTFQRTFRAYNPSYDDGIKPYSISGERRPDMVLSIDNGNGTTMIVLDAKYRCGRDSIHSALGDMHIYRDSLKVMGHGEKLLGAYILVPAHDDDAKFYFTEEYRQRYHIGGFDLAPNQDGQIEDLCQHLKKLITES